MKKFFYSIIAAATMLFATTSCSQDELINNGDTPQGGNGQKVTFKVEMPAEDAASRSIAAGVDVGGGNMADNLIWALYEQGKDKRLDCGHVTGAKNDESGKHEFTVDITMVKGLTYNILFFAYDADDCVFKLAFKPKETDLTALTLVDNLVANNEGYDAFVKCHTYKFGGETTVELTRPFAQVNAATTETDLDKAKQLEAVVTKSELVIKNVPTQYNVLTGEATANGDLTYSATEILKHYVSGNEATPVHPNEEIEIEGEEDPYYYLAMAYVLAGETPQSEQSMHNATFNFYRGENGDDLMRTIDILNLPIQRNWRTNVIGALLTEEESFKIVIDHNFVDDHIIKEDEIAYVTTSEDLEKALKEDLQTIVVNLGEETASRAEGEKLTFDLKIGAWTEKYYWGSSQTKTIIINGNGHTINFVHENGDWNYIRCVNDDATWCFNNVHLTNSGENNGPWNRHDIRFYNAVELQNVTSDKAIAVLNDATLKNVTISDDRASDDYGLWITAEGQTVELDGCTFNMYKENENTGRGIKIADEYVDSPALVTLNVKNTSFKTEKKAAVLVTSTAGANITWGEGNDIFGVADDKICAVWVDEERADYFDLVTVTGCSKLLEGNEAIADGLVREKGTVNYFVSNANGLAKLNQMMADQTAGRDAVVNLTADINFEGKTWTPVDSHADTKFEIAELNGNGHTISNLTINGQAMFTRFAGSGDVVIKDVTFDNATVISTLINTSILTVQCYQKILLDNVDVKNSSITGGYKVAPLIGTVYNENETTVTATLKNCDVENVIVKALTYDFCTTGMVAFVNAGANDKIEFENCTVKDVKLQAPNDGYKAHAAIYTTGSSTLFNEAEGVTVTNVTFEAI